MNKRGQFFIVAALVIIAAIAGLGTVANYAKSGQKTDRFFDLSSEVNFETKRVLDYGVYNADETEGLISDFLYKYSDYIGQEEVIFVYGDKEGLFKALVFNESSVGSIGLTTGLNRDIPIQRRTGRTADVNVVESDGANERIVVSINEISYTFDLREGQNFFFVIIKDQEGDTLVSAK